MQKKNIAVIGGGTGTYTVLTGLKKYPVNLTAIVAMADDGGSTGILRDELGVLPPGDIRRCLVALSQSDKVMRELMNYRFESGGLQGHSFGNILLSALEKVTGSFDQAVEKTSEILGLKGKVIPVTLDKVRLFGYLKNGKILRHESELHRANLIKYKKFALKPKAKANPKAVQAILDADAVVIGPGDFYSSLIPNLLVAGIPEVLGKSEAKKIYVCNVMTKEGHTNGWTVATFAREIERYLKTSLDYIVYNNKNPSSHALLPYIRKGERPVSIDRHLPRPRFKGADLLGNTIPAISKNDPLGNSRTLIRHDSDKLARLIFKIA